MRTNIDINDELMAAVLAATGLKTKKDAVELALTRLLEIEGQKDILRLEGIGWAGNLDEMRRNA